MTNNYQPKPCVTLSDTHVLHNLIDEDTNLYRPNENSNNSFSQGAPMNFTQEQWLDLVKQEMNANLFCDNSVLQKIAHSAIQGGKMIRSKLVLLMHSIFTQLFEVDTLPSDFSSISAKINPKQEVCGAQIETMQKQTIKCKLELNKVRHQLIKACSMIELIQIGTLLHDDVIDESLTRRGKKTTHVEYGNKKSILAGDFMFANVLSLLAEINSSKITLATAASIKKIIRGEMNQDLLTISKSSCELLGLNSRDILTKSSFSPLENCAPKDCALENWAACDVVDFKQTTENKLNISKTAIDLVNKSYQNVISDKTAELFVLAGDLGIEIAREAIKKVEKTDGELELFEREPSTLHQRSFENSVKNQTNFENSMTIDQYISLAKAICVTLGKTFQIVDDISDYFCDYFCDSNLQKDILNDFKNKKLTLPTILMLAQIRNKCEKSSKNKSTEGEARIDEPGIDEVLKMFIYDDYLNIFANRFIDINRCDSKNLDQNHDSIFDSSPHIHANLQQIILRVMYKEGIDEEILDVLEKINEDFMALILNFPKSKARYDLIKMHQDMINNGRELIIKQKSLFCFTA